MKINLDNLFRTASAQLGMPEEQLREAIRSGNTAEIKKHLSAADAQKLDSALKNRRLAEEMTKKYGGG